MLQDMQNEEQLLRNMSGLGVLSGVAADDYATKNMAV